MVITDIWKAAGTTPNGGTTKTAVPPRTHQVVDVASTDVGIRSAVNDRSHERAR